MKHLLNLYISKWNCYMYGICVASDWAGSVTYTPQQSTLRHSGLPGNLQVEERSVGIQLAQPFHRILSGRCGLDTGYSRWKVLRQLFWLFVWVLLYMSAIFSNYLQYVPHPISTQFDKNTQGLINESIVF